MPTPPAEPERISPAEPERMPTPPAERPLLERVDPSVFVNEIEVTSSLITRCDKSTQTISPYLHVKRLDLGKRLLEQQQQANKRLCPTIKQEPLENPVPQIGSKNIVLLVPGNHPLMKLGNNGFIIQPTNSLQQFILGIPYQSNGPMKSHFLLLSTIKAGAQKPVTSFYSRDMEDELAFTLNLALYQEADLGDYITFMMKFRTILNSLKPSEVIQLETVYAMDIIDLLVQVLPDHEPHDVPWFECFSYFEPADLHSDYMEREAAKGKGAFIQALWTEYAKPKLYGLVYKAWRRHGAQTLTTWTLLAQAVLDGCFRQKWPDSVFQVPDACPICLGTMHWPEKTHCGHAFHIRCLLRHLDERNTCPSAEHPTL
ncbi:hypothetical protein TNIN_440611 [Trichonephila inaurata madagascariensis]|uniref:RING-type domain-containing protein n=1 Tax=Trichonephila inaurata madagascariensis TaxID=2747483 RepID=A0A8X7CRC3_9ARAC|nr:hypothetical protein TNIN_440611 [Trichonephila inaurata madagascariensis]